MDTREIRGTYKTRQREEILEFLRDAGSSHVTADEVYQHLQEARSTVGKTTVYRQLEKLVDEGRINKYITGLNAPACFEYIDTAECGEESACYHLRCERCGRLIHLHCGEVTELARHILDEHGFRIDPRRTVFYGLCESCREPEADR
ncbi:MAG: transcriptional repressor [Mogibacterium sp.]|nr:transcriptional repressor [Mogibacterium sp.]